MGKTNWTLLAFVCGIVVGVAAMLWNNNAADSLLEVEQAIMKAQREKNWPLESTLWSVKGAMLSGTEMQLDAIVTRYYTEPMKEYLESILE